MTELKEKFKRMCKCLFCIFSHTVYTPTFKLHIFT
jgi:hypothetical protein